MKILSIDVGIKNLSFCLFELLDDSNIKIIKWDNINLSEKNESKCIEIDKKGLCDKPAKFIKNEKCYCLKHAKKQPFLQPIAELKQSNLNKQKIQVIKDLAIKYKINCDPSLKKANIITLLNEFTNNNCFTPVQKTNASKMDLVTIGRNMQHKFDEILGEHLSSIETIIIENQIGPIANKMKTIQGMISQYFIMKNNDIQIEFISASNKLKDFVSKETTESKELKETKESKELKESNENNETKETIKLTNTQDKIAYKQRKNLGIQICLEMVTNDPRFKEWSIFFNKHNKKDDLSDCFLQGMWFIKHKL